MIKEGITGYLVSPRANGAMAERLIELLDAPQRIRQQMGKRGRSLLSADFEINTTVSKISQLYNDLIGEL